MSSNSGIRDLRLPFLRLLPVLMLGACSTTNPPLPTVEHVDLPRFMGDWYVVASIPTFIEKQAFNAVESYRLTDDGQVETTFRFNEGGYDGPVKTFNPTGFVVEDGSNALWGMQFIWPVRAEFRVIYLEPDYSVTVIGRSKRDYVWIMARSPEISERQYRELVRFLESSGYETRKLRQVPHNGVPSGESSS